MTRSKRFNVLVEAHNVLTEIDSMRGRFGFYTWRVINASDEAEASLLAKRQVSQDFAARIKNEPSDPPSLAVAELQELLCSEADSRTDTHINTGAAWFLERADKKRRLMFLGLAIAVIVTLGLLLR